MGERLCPRCQTPIADPFGLIDAIDEDGDMPVFCSVECKGAVADAIVVTNEAGEGERRG